MHGHTETSGYPRQKICRLETIDFKKTDAPYINNGTYRFIVRVFPIKGKELSIHEGKMIDANHGYDYYLNEYGDTVMKEYIDYTNIAKEE